MDGPPKSTDQEDPPSDERKIQDLRMKHRPMTNDDAPADDDRILPLTDKEWAEHITEVRDSLSDGV